MKTGRIPAKKRPASKRAVFMTLKQPDKVRVANPKCTQDTIEIGRVASNGIFQVGKEKWSKSYRLTDVNYTTKTYDEQLAFFYDWCKTLNSFDVSVKITIFNENRNMEEIKEKILCRYKEDGYDWLRRAYNDIIESRIVEGRQGICQEKFLTITVERKDYEAARAYLASLESSFISNFASLSCVLVPLDANERFRVLHAFYHMGHEAECDFHIEDDILRARSFKDALACRVMDFDSQMDRFSMDDTVCSVLYLDPASYPTSLSDTFIKNLTSLPVRCVCSIDYEPIPQDVALKTLEDKLMGVENTIAKQQEKRNRRRAFSSDISYKVRREKKALERMLDELQENDQKMFWTGVTVAVLADGEDKLEDGLTAVHQVAEKASCKLIPYYMRQRQAAATALPVGGRYVDMMRALFTSSAAAFVPFNVTEMQMMDQPFYYGINQVSKEPIWANRKKLLNGNGFVFAVPGGGKSFTGCKFEAGNVFLNTDDDIIFVDPTLEYFDVAEAYGGAVINLATYTKNYLNPMEVDLATLDPEDRNEQVREKCSFMLGICEQAMDGGIRPEYKSLIDRAVRDMYKRVAALPIEERKQPVMSDFIRELELQDEPEARKIKLVLEIFTDGSLNIFNHPTNIDIENRVLVYGLRDLSGDLSGMAMLIMLENIRMRIIKNARLGRATWLYVDEFHVLLGKPFSRDYLIALWKQVRKLGGLCTGITQNVVEVLKDPMTSTLVSNSEYTVLLKQAAPDAAVLGKALENLSAEQIKYTVNPKPGTGLIRFGSTIIPFDNHIEKTNPVYDLYNTNLHEKAAKRRAELGSV